MPLQLSIVIPAYNEERRLGPSLDRIAAYCAARGLDHEIVVVDDGSTDRTAELVSAHPAPGLRLLRQPANRGKGAALRAGVAASAGERVLVTDADLSAPIAELERLEPRLDAGADLVLGSRAAPGARLVQRQPLYRELMGKTFNRVVRLLGVHGLADTQCGFKLLTGAAARDLFPRLTVDRFAYDVELVWLARRRGFRVEEVGVEWSDSGDSRVHALRDSAAMLRDVIGMRWRHRGGPSGPDQP
jgi:dolichyl-phosphate beta-glucosyltransferase